MFASTSVELFRVGEVAAVPAVDVVVEAAADSTTLIINDVGGLIMEVMACCWCISHNI